MSENRLNAILYTILAIVVLLYLYFNVVTVLFHQTAVENEITKKTLFNAEDKKNGAEVTNTSHTGSEPGSSSGGSRDVNNPDEIDWKEDESVEMQQNKTHKDKTQQNNEADARNIIPSGYHIYVDLDLPQMFVYKDGELIKTYEVSGGKPSTPSPVGTWKIISKDTWGEGFGGAWLGFDVPWGMYGIHGTTEPWFVGRSNTSKGCIRMKNDEVRELYKLIPYDTVVTIVYDNRPFYPMQDGDVGSDVLAVEKALKELGYYNGSEDGIFGELLKKAVKEFQKDHKLYVTGVVNISTYELIMEKEMEMENFSLFLQI